MKTKKIFLVILAVVLLFTLSACGSKPTDNGASGDSADAGTELGFDLKGEGKQTISEERATVDTLQAALDWQNGMSDAEKFSLTYEDYKAQIGLDANEYEWNGLSNYGVYYWYASDDDSVSLHPVFKNGDGTLFAGGSNGLSF